jgi:hypothetical protein
MCCLQEDHVIPARTKCEAVELLHLCDRADEEAVRIREDIKAAMEHFCILHNALIKAADEASPASRSLLLRKAYDIDSSMQYLWVTAHKHISVSELCDRPTLSLDFNLGITDPNNDDNCDVDWDFDCSDDDDDDEELI